MADPTIKIKRSAVEGKIPTADQVPLGEIALNTYDGKLFASKNVGIGTTVFVVNPWSVGTGTNTYNTYFTAGNVGINTTNPQYKLHVIGSFAATTKSFVIDHPTKEGMKLRYGSLEGPENGVYARGRLKGNNTIELPEYWTELVDEDSITVNLTPIGRKAPLHSIVDIVDNTVVIESANDIVDCFYTVFAERKDVAKLEVEF